MLDVANIINYNRTDEELEELILFLVAVAGKNATTTARQIASFLAPKHTWSPFEYIKAINTGSLYGTYSKIGKNKELVHNNWYDITTMLKKSGFGCYTRLARAFKELTESNLNLRTCTMEDLMQIHGIGRKSASCFLAWTRKGVQVAMLDTHLLKFLREEQGTKYVSFCEDPILDTYRRLDKITIPKSTPSSKKLYDELENIYLEICKHRGVNPTEYDLEIWRRYALPSKSA